MLTDSEFSPSADVRVWSLFSHKDRNERTCFDRTIHYPCLFLEADLGSCVLLNLSEPVKWEEGRKAYSRAGGRINKLDVSHLHASSIRCNYDNDFCFH